MNEVLLTSSQAARLLGISVVTLRMWHKTGKFVPSGLTPNRITLQPP
jgi:DNA-binding transcriptional MerR regulator